MLPDEERVDPYSYRILVKSKIRRVRYNPMLLKPGALVRVMWGQGASVQVRKYVVCAAYDPAVSEVIVRTMTSKTMRAIDPLKILDVNHPAVTGSADYESG